MKASAKRKQFQNAREGHLSFRAGDFLLSHCFEGSWKGSKRVETGASTSKRGTQIHALSQKLYATSSYRPILCQASSRGLPLTVDSLDFYQIMH